LQQLRVFIFHVVLQLLELLRWEEGVLVPLKSALTTDLFNKKIVQFLHRIRVILYPTQNFEVAWVSGLVRTGHSVF